MSSRGDAWGSVGSGWRYHWFRSCEAKSACSDHCEAILRPGARREMAQVSAALGLPRRILTVPRLAKGLPQGARLCGRCLSYREAAEWVAGFHAGVEAAARIVQPLPHVEEERECSGVAREIRSLKPPPSRSNAAKAGCR